MKDVVTVMREVYALGGSLSIEGDRLIMKAHEPLPSPIREAVRTLKPEIMIALGAPLDAVTSAVLRDLQPRLPYALQSLSSEQLLNLVQMAFVRAWKEAEKQVEEG